MKKKFTREEGSIELIVLGLLAALIVVLAVPLLTSIGQETEKSLSSLESDLVEANQRNGVSDENPEGTTP